MAIPRPESFRPELGLGLKLELVKISLYGEPSLYSLCVLMHNVTRKSLVQATLPICAAGIPSWVTSLRATARLFSASAFRPVFSWTRANARCARASS